jgi:pyruvate kinase
VRAFYYDEEESLDGISDQIDILKERGFRKKGKCSRKYGKLSVHLHSTNVLKITKVK